MQVHCFQEAGAESGFRRGGNISFGQMFPKNCIKMKTTGTRGKHASKICLCRSATEIYSVLFSTTISSQRFIFYFFHNRNSGCGRHIVNFCGSISEDVDDEIWTTEYTFTNSDFQPQKLRDENNSICNRIRLSSSLQFTWYWYILVVLFSQF